MGLKIKNGVLSGYTPLTRKKPDLEIPEGVTEVAPEAFRDQPNLWAVKCPASLRRIGEGAFQGCTDLKEVKLQEGITELEAGAFEDCIRLESCELPQTLTHIGMRAFACDKALKITGLPRSLQKIGKSAFDGCKELTERIIIPAGCETVGDKAFNHCHALRDVAVMRGFSGMAQTALADCKNLETLTVMEGIKRCAFNVEKRENVPDFSGEIALLLEGDYQAPLPQGIRQRLLVQMFVSGFDEKAASAIALQSREVLDDPALLRLLLDDGRLIRVDNIMELIQAADAAGFSNGKAFLMKASNERGEFSTEGW